MDRRRRGELSGVTRSSKSDLSILSRLSKAPPLFASPVHVGGPNIGSSSKLFTRLKEVIDRRWLTNDGPLVLELERKFASFLGVAHCVAVSNGTLGLQLAARALDLTGEILMPSFTFIGTAHAFSWVGLKPVFCDVLPEDHTLDPQDVESKIGPATTAILGVHLWGRPCRIAALQEIADAKAVPLIFDAAQALGSSSYGRKIGNFGCLEVFSLHATKIVNSLEGGLITTNDRLLADKLRRLRNFGFNGLGTVVDYGTNAKMNEFSAAMGLTNLEAYPDLAKHNRRICDVYGEGLARLEGIRSMSLPENGITSQHYFVLEVTGQSPVSRNTLYEVLRAENVLVRRYFEPGCHRTLPYTEGCAPLDLPVTDALSQRLLQLPTGQQMNEDSAHDIVSLIKLCHEMGPALEDRLARYSASSSCSQSPRV